MSGRRDFAFDVGINPAEINQSVHTAIKEAMHELDRNMEELKNLQFSFGGRRHPGHDRETVRPRPRDERHREFRERRDMHDTLKALERGEISVDEAMERLDE